jgi:hypothetical protein
MNQNVGDTIVASINQGLVAAGRFLPNLVAGIIILLIGIVLGSIVKRLLLSLFDGLNIEKHLKRYGIPESPKDDFTWSNILSEIARWFVIVLFLVPTADVWGLPQVTTLLNSFLLYIPNVVIAAIIGVVGIVFGRIAYDVVRASTRELSPDGSRAIATTAKWAIIIFAVLAMLNQLGVAQDLIRILFTGIVAMLALAGGIAFGLGGKDTARIILESLRKNLENTKPTPKAKK